MARVKCLLFDLGGVLLSIDHARAKKKLSHLLNIPIEQLDKIYAEDQSMLDYEKGLLERSDFLAWGKEKFSTKFSEREFIEAWNLVLGSFDWEMFELLERLKSRYELYLLSNTNCLHLERIGQMLDAADRKGHYLDLFNQHFYSFEMGHRKPEAQVYTKVLQQIDCMAQDVLFIDDSQSNIEAADTLNFQTLLWKPKQHNAKWLSQWLSQK